MKNLKIAAIFIFISIGCAQPVSEGGFYSVHAVLDGDTIILTNARNVRYIGVDAPETRERTADEWVWNPQPYAIEALNLNRRLVEGKRVRLEFDKEPTDRYDRWLAYVFVDGKMVNEELLRYGYATVYIRHPNTKYLDRLTAAEKEAKDNKRGLWSAR